MSIIRRVVVPLVAGLGAAVLLLPGSAGASLPRPYSHTSMAAATVANGDTAWALAVRLCGRGEWHTRLTIRSPQGTLRVDHDRIWPGDRVSGCGATAAPAPRAAAPTAGWVRPVSGYTYGRGGCFGDPREWKWVWRNGKQVKIVTRWHKGVDLTLRSGRPIVAAHAGTVVRAGWWSRGYGISVLIHHSNGLYSHYAHMSVDVVSVGQRVGTGQLIGRVGSTGHSSGPHVHFEIWRGWWGQIPPRAFMARMGVTGIGC